MPGQKKVGLLSEGRGELLDSLNGFLDEQECEQKLMSKFAFVFIYLFLRRAGDQRSGPYSSVPVDKGL